MGHGVVFLAAGPSTESISVAALVVMLSLVVILLVTMLLLIIVGRRLRQQREGREKKRGRPDRDPWLEAARRMKDTPATESDEGSADDTPDQPPPGS